MIDALLKYDDIHEIYFNDTALTNQQLERLVQRGNVGYIEIANTHVTDEALAEIAGRCECDEIYLPIPNRRKSKSLREFVFSSSKVSFGVLDFHNTWIRKWGARHLRAHP